MYCYIFWGLPNKGGVLPKCNLHFWENVQGCLTVERIFPSKRSSWEDLVEILLHWSPLWGVLAWPCTGPCEKVFSHKDLRKIMQEPLREDFARISARSSWTCTTSCKDLLERTSPRSPQDLLIRVGARSCKDFLDRTSIRSSQELRTRTCTRPVSRPSYMKDGHETLARSS